MAQVLVKPFGLGELDSIPPDGNARRVLLATLRHQRSQFVPPALLRR